MKLELKDSEAVPVGGDGFLVEAGVGLGGVQLGEEVWEVVMEERVKHGLQVGE